MKTLGEFIIQKKYEYPGANSDIGGILASIRLVAKIIHREINRAGLSNDILGATKLENVQGEIQMKLDYFANETMKKALLGREDIAGFASEENENFVEFDTERAHKAKYILMTDPLDGSSNIDVNVSIGTIFSIYERISPIGGPLTLEDFLQEGRKQIAAGYIIYGSSTMLVYTTGHGVNGFTYDNALGIFILSHPNMKIPQAGRTYSINEGKLNMFNDKIKGFIDYCREYDPSTNRPFDSRYSGAMVADFHRILLKGGIYMYPKSTFYPEGKLRLLYEGNPIAFLAEQAGGLAISGDYTNILEIKPTRLHQRIECFVGSKNIIEKFKSEF